MTKNKEKTKNYVIELDGEFYRDFVSLSEARKVYRSLKNIYEVEGKLGNIKLYSKKIEWDLLSEDDFNTESVMQVPEMGEELEEVEF